MLYQVRDGKTYTVHEATGPEVHGAGVILDISPKKHEQAIKAGIITPYKNTVIPQTTEPDPKAAPEPKAKVITPEDAEKMTPNEPQALPKGADFPALPEAPKKTDESPDEMDDSDFAPATDFGG